MPSMSFSNWGLRSKFGSWTSWCWGLKDNLSYKQIIGGVGTLIGLYGLYYAYGIYSKKNLEKNYPIVLHLNLGNKSTYDQNMKDGKLIDVRMSNPSWEVFQHVMTMYHNITNGKDPKKFSKYWMKDEEGKSFLNDVEHIGSFQTGIQTEIHEIHEKNNRVNKLNNSFKDKITNNDESYDFNNNSLTLFSLNRSSDRFSLSYDKINDDAFMYHLSYIRQAYQLLQKRNTDHHDITELSFKIANFMFLIKPLNEWKEEIRKDKDLFTETAIEEIRQAYDLDKGWSGKVYDYTIGLGINTMKWGYNTVAHWNESGWEQQMMQEDDRHDRPQIVGNANMLNNAVDLKDYQFVGEIEEV